MTLEDAMAAQKTPHHRDQTMRSHRQPAVTKKEVELKQAKIEVEALQLWGMSQ